MRDRWGNVLLYTYQVQMFVICVCVRLSLSYSLEGIAMELAVGK